MRKIALSKILSLVISVLMLYTATMLKRGNGKTYRLYKKDKKSFSKAPCEALDIKQPIGQNSQLHSFTASQLHSFTASQLRGSCAHINLQSNTDKFTQPITRTRANSRLCAFFISHRLINRKERKELSFAQLHKGIIGMSYGLRQVNSMDNV